jgi:hypothetical protein
MEWLVEPKCREVVILQTKAVTSLGPLPVHPGSMVDCLGY